MFPYPILILFAIASTASNGHALTHTSVSKQNGEISFSSVLVPPLTKNFPSQQRPQRPSPSSTPVNSAPLPQRQQPPALPPQRQNPPPQPQRPPPPPQASSHPTRGPPGPGCIDPGGEGGPGAFGGMPGMPGMPGPC